MVTYYQIALWLRRCTNMTFSDNVGTQRVSAQLFSDAADSADQFAENPGIQRPDADGLFPLAADFQ